MKKLSYFVLLFASLNLFADSKTVDLAEKSDLVFMREEEKLAGDVYYYFFNKYRIDIFKNIRKSEQTHTTAIGALLTKYQIADPSYLIVGKYSNPDLQALYDSLIKRGSVSLVEALKVGALIEEVDMIDIKKAISRTDNPDIQTTYGNLLNGSKNHLSSFVLQLKKQGIIYSPEI